MLTAGVDIGAKTAKAIVMRDDKVVGQAVEVAGFDAAAAANATIGAALASAGIARDEITSTVATGSGRDQVPDAARVISDVAAAARGASYLYPGVRTVIDVGAEDGRAVRCDERGKVVDFAINDKCAAGAGAFTESMAQMLEVPLPQLGTLSLQAAQAAPMNAQCVVFAESEVVAMIHGNVAKQEIARAVHDAIAARIASMARKVGYNAPVVLVGGLARNTGFVDSLRRGLDVASLQVPEAPELCGALGAALAAAEGQQSG